MEESDALTFPDAPRAELDRVLAELVDRARGVLTTQGRLRALLRANQAVVQQLDLPVVLQRIVDVAVELVGAQYGALGVIAPYGGLEQFIYVGMTPHDVEVIGHLPEGHGLLGAVIDDPRRFGCGISRTIPARLVSLQATADGQLPRCSGAGSRQSLRQSLSDQSSRRRVQRR
jgi:hypothetical protein